MIASLKKILSIGILFPIALYAQGVSQKFQLNKTSLRTSNSFANQNSIGSNVVNQFGFNDHRNELWFGSLSGLISLTDAQTSTYRLVTSIPKFNQNGVQAIAVKGNTIWSSTSTYLKDAATGDGLIYSYDGGNSWTELAQPLDGINDTTEQYGINTLQALPIIVPQQNVIYSISIGDSVEQKPVSVWISTWSGGIRRTTNNGASWQRMTLPAGNLRSVSPTDTLNFKIEPERKSSGYFVFLGFSVLAASDGSVWAGTVDGVCRTTDPDTIYPSWIKYNRSSSGLSGNWIVALKEQPETVNGTTTNPSMIWTASWRGNDNSEIFGASYTSDNGFTWNVALENERLYDFSFAGDTIYAVGTNGLFTSPDRGKTWFNKRTITDKDNSRIFIKSNSEFYSTIVQPLQSGGKRLWIGTADGTAYSDNGGVTWKIERADIPTTDDVKTYAYPNPFSPNIDRIARIKYKLNSPSTVTIRIMDFGMNLVRTVINGESRSPKANGDEEDIWNGKTDFGARVANGVYFYSVEISGQKPLRGKILVLD